MNTICDIETLFEMVEVDREDLETKLDALVETKYVEKILDQADNTYFKSKEGLSWSDAVRIDCEVKKQILLCMIPNPKTFFVLYNTQKGKLKIAAEEIRSWASVDGKRVVGLLMVDNDKTLADQSSDGVRTIVGDVADIFLLSSNSGDSLEDIKNKIDSYAAFGGKMPVIVALNNGKQIEKVTKLMSHIKMRMLSGCSSLRYGIVFDEADKIYPPVRERFIDYLINDDVALHRLGFVTATEGDLMDAEYPECANAYMFPVPPGNPDYRAIHTQDAIIKHVVHRSSVGNDAYAEAIITDPENKSYFNNQIRLKNGSMGFRKVIVNGGSKRASMEAFAMRRIAEGSYAITVNMNGVVVYRQGHEKKKYSAKGTRFGELLFKAYKELGLHNKPLFIIGRKKVDRGLGFHFTPRDGSEGLVWTDMILGRVDDKSTSIQKAGRLAGVVVHCPQYSGSLTWWTDEKTSSMICRHNDVVDSANSKKGCSALQALVRGEAEVPKTPIPETKNDVLISKETFTTMNEAREWGRLYLDQSPSVFTPCDSEGKSGGQTHFHYRGELREISSEKSTRESKDISWGQGTFKEDKNVKSKTGSPRVFPVRVDTVLKFIVVYKRFNIKV
jgi:hypothetical protein